MTHTVKNEEVERMTEVVKLYLSMETNHALLITGKWGVGKTYYYQNKLSPLISATPVHKDNRKKYKPIRISLFGLKSVEEVQTEILLTLYPILKNSKLKIGTSITKVLLQAYLKLKGYDDYFKMSENVKVKKSDVVNILDLEELVICFDDLERINKSLNIEEFIGYVNTLIEEQNNKVLIIANEGEITDETFKKFKEKVIGNTIEFQVNLNEAYDSIVATSFNGNRVYQTFLHSNKDFILESFSSASQNLRTLIYLLKYFQVINSEIEINLPRENALIDRKQEILENLLKFSIAICIEYKKAQITFKDHNGLVYSGIELFDAPEKKESEKTYRDRFKERYFDKKPFTFFGSIYNYLTGGQAFDYDDLLRQLKSYYHVKNDVIEPQYQVFDKLLPIQCFSLSDEEYLQLSSKLYEHATSGDFNLQEYQSIFEMLMRFKNPMGFDANSLEKEIISGMEKGRGKYVHSHSLEFHTEIHESSEFKEPQARIRANALAINEELRRNNIEEEKQLLESLCYSDFPSFADKISDNESKFPFTPILAGFDSERFFNLYLEKNDLRIQIQHLIATRYRENHHYLVPEKTFICGLMERATKVNSLRQGVNLSGYLVERLLRYLNEANDKLTGKTLMELE